MSPQSEQPMDQLREYLKAERGRLSRLAEALGVAPSSIAQWTRVPAERVPAVAAFTGLSWRALRPDMFEGSEG